MRAVHDDGESTFRCRRVGFAVVDLASDERAIDQVKQLGYLSAPVVVDGAQHWSGFDPERIKAAAAR
jgi:glutaredoxin-like protein NrdH